MLVFVNEKIATSAPEISAEQINKTISRMMLVTNEVFEIRKIVLRIEGSGSKLKRFK